MKRGRNQRRRPGNNPNRALDSNGPEVRIRGTANQIYDKYIALARDASSSGDRIKAESCLQHAEHYFRILRAAMPPPQSQSSHHSSPEGSTSEQPSIDNGSDRANENSSERSSDRSNDRSEERRPERHSRGRDRDERTTPREEDKPEAAAAPSEEAPVSTQDEDAPEPKPKRRRAKRTAKPAAKEGDEASDVEEATAAAE